jgi:hypothetical protein
MSIYYEGLQGAVAGPMDAEPNERYLPIEVNSLRVGCTEFVARPYLCVAHLHGWTETIPNGAGLRGL